MKINLNENSILKLNIGVQPHFSITVTIAIENINCKVQHAEKGTLVNIECSPRYIEC